MNYARKQWQMDPSLLKEVMLYIAAKCKDNEKFGATILNKTLFFADFLAYRKSGSPITGSTYRKAPNGPMSASYQAMCDQLVAGEDAEIELRPCGRYEQKRLVPKREPDVSELSQGQLDILDEVIHQLSDKTAIEASDLSHSARWWQSAEGGEELPYELALSRCPDGVSDAQLEDAKAIQAAIDAERAA